MQLFTPYEPYDSGAWSLEDIVAIDAEEFFVEVTVERERSSLRVKPIIPSSLDLVSSSSLLS